MKRNALIALHYAFRCQGTDFQRHQSNRIIVYVIKNTSFSFDDLLKGYEEEEERVEMKRIMQKRIPEIQKIQHHEKMKKQNVKNGDHGKNGRSVVVHDNYLSVRSAKKDSDRLQLLERALSNNSVSSLEPDSDELSETY